MRVVLQRVSRAAVRVDGQTVGAIGRGFLVLAGFAPGDSEAALAWMAEKIAGMLKGSEPTFVAVGAGHLLGPSGLVELLRAKGYKVTKMRGEEVKR